jgi:hypothetical protein
MINSRLKYYLDIDKNAKAIATDLVHNHPVSNKILKAIISMYQSAKVEQQFKDNFFETAYHSPITGELEFFISRILYHQLKAHRKDWKILLRRLEKKTAPDIRQIMDNKTFAIIEVKAKAFRIQPFLSLERYQNDKTKLQNGKSSFDPETLKFNSKKQLKNYFDTFSITNNDVFLFLQTLAMVHWKKIRPNLIIIPTF